MSFIDEMPFSLILIACLTLGLAPYAPPHIWEKLGMLASGTLVEPVDIFDLVMHGAPWLLLVLKLVRLKRA
ncbi:RND transporter [Aliiroseovarius sp. S253]|uniref:RND transporter n=1 Tax=Aliiroseovarius sp. S253 TaxID=3415133 RepID=UPI003C7B2505